MTGQNLKTLKMIASNCALDKAQRDMLDAIIKEELQYCLHAPEKVPDTDRDVVIFVQDAWGEEPFALIGRNASVNGKIWEVSDQASYKPLSNDLRVVGWKELDKRGIN